MLLFPWTWSYLSNFTQQIPASPDASSLFSGKGSYLCVETNEEKHEEEEYGPERGERHLRDGFWVGHKHQTRA